MGNSILCSKLEAEGLVETLQNQADHICDDFNMKRNLKEPVSMRIYSKEYSDGYGVHSDLIFGERIIKRYAVPEEAFSDLLYILRLEKYVKCI